MTAKAKLFFILLTVISFSLTFASAFDFQLSSPDEVYLNDSFNISISSNETNLTYDVKAFVNDDTRNYSEILSDGEWKSPFYYLIGVYPASKEFTLRALQLGNFSICARLRETDTDSYDENCNNISIAENPNPPEEPAQNITNNSSNQTSQNATNNSSEEEEENLVLSNTTPITTSLVNSNLQNSESSEENEIIYLNKPSADSNSSKSSEKSFISGEEKTRLIIAYSFAGLCLLILVLVLLKRI